MSTHVNRPLSWIIRRYTGEYLRKCNILNERTLGRVSGVSVGYKQHSTGDANTCGRGSGSERTTLLKSVAVGLGLGSAAVLHFRGDEEDNVCERRGLLCDSILERVLPTAHCASPFKPDSPRFKFNFIADVVEKSTPAVVYIEIVGRHPFSGREVPISNGSGFIVSSDGLIVTNAHVVANKRGVRVKLTNGETYNATVQDVDQVADIATIKINAQHPPRLSLLFSTSRLSLLCSTLPVSLFSVAPSPYLSPLHISLLSISLSSLNLVDTLIQINFGNSGGPLINLDGEVIGINTMKVTAGISFAIPSDHVKHFLNQASDKKKSRLGVLDTKRRYIGVMMLTLTPSIIAELKLRDPSFPDVTYGIMIHRVIMGSPANRAGMKPGDIVLEINGTKVNTSEEIYNAVRTSDSITMGSGPTQTTHDPRVHRVMSSNVAS
ncbi:unnamed protein product [Oncorhynchus mykiss]|uniref:PDZ domain-containing protein n=1 Tax=Oncorhynchus mykiss TaxID=8022 RepID=A0A060XE12_ONCMY|nr:unnamed protein product [Oncorhynchus mykiss]